jgi:hypothetical protein
MSENRLLSELGLTKGSTQHSKEYFVDKEKLMQKLMTMNKNNIDMVKSYILGLIAQRQLQSKDVKKNEKRKPLMNKHNDNK